jgi:hypothetical protein
MPSKQYQIFRWRFFTAAESINQSFVYNKKITSQPFSKIEKRRKKETAHPKLPGEKNHLRIVTHSRDSCLLVLA